MKLIAQDISDFLDCELIGDGNISIVRFSSVKSSRDDSLIFMTEDYSLAECQFGVVIITEAEFSKIDQTFNTYLIVDNPKLAFVRVLKEFYRKDEIDQNIYEKGVSIHKTVIIEGDVYIGNNVKIQPYVTIGTEGFGHVRNEKREWEEFPQIGGVIIEDNVEIATGTNIHRGTLDDTIIEEGTKISTHCNIGHNSVIGKHVFIGGNTNLGGRTQIGDYSFIGMRVVTKPGIKIGRNVTVGMGSVILKDIPDNVLAYGHPAKVIEKNIHLNPKFITLHGGL